MLRYQTVTNVFLDGKIIGAIHETSGGFQYIPKGKKTKQGGKFFPTLAWCKHSLTSTYEDEDNG